MIYGCDFLGAARYKKTVLAEQPRSYGFGVFAEVDGFGSAYDLIKQLDNYGLPFFRIQLIWKDDHKFSNADVKIAEARAKKIAALKLRTKLYISPCCENELNAAQFEPFAEVIRWHLPSATIVNSPNKGKGHVSSKYLNEYHHEKPRSTQGRFAFSYDGANCVDSNIEEDKRLYANAEYFMLWNSQCNGNRKIFKPTDKRGPLDFKDRAKRIYWPTPKQIDSWIWLTTHNRGATQCPKPGVFKSHSDQHKQPPEGKDQKPVWVKYLKWKAIEVKARNGQLIDKAPYFGTFEGGGHRYYHSQWGFDLAQKAIRIQGDAICNVFADGKKIGTINLAYRDGGYR